MEAQMNARIFTIIVAVGMSQLNILKSTLENVTD
jgi:hypothetical protein